MRVYPGSRFDKIGVNCAGMLHIQITAVPEKGKANEKLINIIAKWLGINKGAIRIVQGETSRVKLLEIPEEYKVNFIQKVSELDKNNK
ncbi:MAG TPA: DUF167 domain-containing protein [Candidatus Hydrogenedens sp.]|nr:DUF167 domain-containing protein [Candidatus Hydrogenedens sp.]